MLERLSRFLLPLISVAGLLAAALAMVTSHFFHTSQIAKHEDWEWEQMRIGLYLKHRYGGTQPLIAIDAAGALPYYYEGPCIDMLGLNDRHIAKHPVPKDDIGFLAHDKGDGKYVFDRKPSIIIMSGGYHPIFRSDLELLALPEFRQVYEPVTLASDGVRMDVWFKKNDPKLR